MNGQYTRLQRSGFVVIGAEIVVLLAIIGLASFKANDFISSISALAVVVWVLSLIYFTVCSPSLIWPVALLQTTIVIVIAVPAAANADGAAIKCFFLGMATVVVANGLARLRACLDASNNQQ